MSSPIVFNRDTEWLFVEGVIQAAYADVSGDPLKAKLSSYSKGIAYGIENADGTPFRAGDVIVTISFRSIGGLLGALLSLIVPAVYLELRVPTLLSPKRLHVTRIQAFRLCLLLGPLFRLAREIQISNALNRTK